MNDQLIDMRRELHKIPEIGNHLPKTFAFVTRQLETLKIPYASSENDWIVAEIKGNFAGPVIGFRADMDALNLVEETGLSYSSETEGKMHACGHDAHTAILLAAAEIINRNKDLLHGTVRLLFQSGEETGTGAKSLIESGYIEDMEAVFALHVGNVAGDGYAPGAIVVLPGAVSAGKIKFTITVKGKSTHSAFPEKGIDPISISARIITASEELAARELRVGEAAVLSFGSISAGTDHNTIPNTAVIKGSIRAQKKEIRGFLADRLTTICTDIAHAFRGTVKVDLSYGSQTIINDYKLSIFVQKTLSSVLDDSLLVTEVDHEMMGSDDFANYVSKIPGVYFFLCTNNKEKGISFTNHNSKFDVDEDVLWNGVAAYVSIAMNYQKNKDEM